MTTRLGFQVTSTDHSIAYENFVMDKYIKEENTLKRYLSADFPFLIPYFSKRLIFNKEEKILTLRLRYSLS